MWQNQNASNQHKTKMQMMQIAPSHTHKKEQKSTMMKAWNLAQLNKNVKCKNDGAKYI